MIYFIQGKPGTPIKIGYTEYPAGVDRRRDTLQTAHPYPLSVLMAFEGDLALEREIHKLLAADRLLGEWFEDTPRVRYLMDNAYREEWSLIREELGAPDLAGDPTLSGHFIAEGFVSYVFGVRTITMPGARKKGTGPRFYLAHNKGGPKYARYYKISELEAWLREQNIAYFIHKDRAREYYREPGDVNFVREAAE